MCYDLAIVEQKPVQSVVQLFQSDVTAKRRQIFRPITVKITDQKIIGNSAIFRSGCYRVFLIISGFLTSTTQPAITCSKLTIEALKQGVKYVQS